MIKNLGEGFCFLYPIPEFMTYDVKTRQFRLTVGAPDAEAKFKDAMMNATKEDANVKKFPVLYVHSKLYHR